jgi:hypothetical protein
VEMLQEKVLFVEKDVKVKMQEKVQNLALLLNEDNLLF